MRLAAGFIGGALALLALAPLGAAACTSAGPLYACTFDTDGDPIPERVVAWGPGFLVEVHDGMDHGNASVWTPLATASAGAGGHGHAGNGAAHGSIQASAVEQGSAVSLVAWDADTDGDGAPEAGGASTQADGGTFLGSGQGAAHVAVVDLDGDGDWDALVVYAAAEPWARQGFLIPLP